MDKGKQLSKEQIERLKEKKNKAVNSGQIVRKDGLTKN